jgi:hypothetical protein
MSTSKVKTFFDHIGEWFQDHLGNAATFEKTAATAISVAEPLLDTLLALAVGEPFAAKVQAIANQVVNDLNNTSAILKGAEATGGMTVTSLLTSVQTNLGTLLADADIKSSAKSAEITDVVNTLSGEVEAILTAASATPPAPVAVPAPAPAS